MEIATLMLDGKARPVVLRDDRTQFVDVRELLSGFDGDMVDLIAAQPNPSSLATTSAAKPQALAGHRLLPPIGTPRRNIFCVGKNYHAHAQEFSRSGFDSAADPQEEVPPYPVIFTKPPSAVVGPHDAVRAHAAVTSELDYEAELAVVIGTGGSGIKRADALRHVWGYTIVNDVTARDLQKRHRQWFLGKGLDTFCPMGPWIVSADAVDATNLAIRCWVNDELRQQANTRELIFDIPTLIETISAGIALQPGDIIATGTPAGVGIGFTPPRFLRSGDVVRIEIDGLGTLVNTIQ